MNLSEEKARGNTASKGKGLADHCLKAGQWALDLATQVLSSRRSCDEVYRWGSGLKPESIQEAVQANRKRVNGLGNGKVQESV